MGVASERRLGGRFSTIRERFMPSIFPLHPLMSRFRILTPRTTVRDTWPYRSPVDQRRAQLPKARYGTSAPTVMRNRSFGEMARRWARYRSRSKVQQIAEFPYT